jgi:hypothetical protein
VQAAFRSKFGPFISTHRVSSFTRHGRAKVFISLSSDLPHSGSHRGDMRPGSWSHSADFYLQVNNRAKLKLGMLVRLAVARVWTVIVCGVVIVLKLPARIYADKSRN